jgi:hypothetical protein
MVVEVDLILAPYRILTSFQLWTKKMNAAAPASARINNMTKKAYFSSVKGNKQVEVLITITSYGHVTTFDRISWGCRIY